MFFRISLIISIAFFGFSFNSMAQIIIDKKVLIEEFTSVNSEACVEQSVYLDQVVNSSNKAIRIKYHTALEGFNQLYEDSKADVDRRIEKYTFIDAVPQCVINGRIRPQGNLELGSSGNLSYEGIDSLHQEGSQFYFFGVEHTFTEDYKEMFISGGGVSSGLSSSVKVRYTQAIIEEIVRFDEPIGPDDELEFNYVFRKFNKYQEGFTIPANGSTHGWDKIPIPSNIKNLDRLGVVHIFEDNSGKVLNAYFDHPFNVDEYKLIVTTKTPQQENYSDKLLLPKLGIKNRGSMAVSEYYIAMDINGQISRDTLYQTLNPGEELTYFGDSIWLDPGKNKIRIYVEDFAENHAGAVLNNDMITRKFNVFGEYTLPHITFESPAHLDSIGNFMDLTENPHAFKNISATYFDSDFPIGANGDSERSMLIDYHAWKYDFNNQANNTAYMVLGTFDMSNVKVPVLKMDISTPGSVNIINPFQIKISSNKIIRTYKFDSEQLFTMPKRDGRYVPSSTSIWKELEINLAEFTGHKNISIEVRARNTSGYYLNALYIDNIRVEDEAEKCAPDGLQFTRQSQIDSFPLIHGACNIVQGDLTVMNMDDQIEDDILDLSPLKQIAYVDGNMIISGLDSLERLDPFNNIIEIGASLVVSDNDNLWTIGFNKLQKIGEDLIIKNNPTQYYLGNFNLIQEIKGNLELENLPGISSMEPFENIAKVGGDLKLKGLIRPFFFDQMAALNDVGGSITIDSCLKVFRFFTLDKLDTLHGDFIFSNLELANNFDIFPNVTLIEGDVKIQNVVNLRQMDWISGVKKIDGDLELIDLPNLHDLNGLNELESISDDLVLSGIDTLQNIYGLDAISEIGGDLRIINMRDLTKLDAFKELLYLNGSLDISENNALPNLNSFSKLMHIGGQLTIAGNQVLKDISAIKSLEPVYIGDQSNEDIILSISDNPELIFCDNAFTCSFLELRPEEAFIQNNALDCLDKEEVIAACLSSTIDENAGKMYFYPNPVHDIMSIQCPEESSFEVYSSFGSPVYKNLLKEGENNFDLEDLKPGIYFLVLKNGDGFRFVKE